MILSGVKVGKRKRKPKNIEKDDKKQEQNKSEEKRSLPNKVSDDSLATNEIPTTKQMSTTSSSSSNLSNSQKLNNRNDDSSHSYKFKEDNDKSIIELKAEEIRSKESMDEIYARNIVRLGPHYKGTDLGASSSGLEEDDVDTAASIKLFNSKSYTATSFSATNKQKQSSTQLDAIISKYWWWMESPSFRRHMLISFGNHVSLVKAPMHLSLIKDHCYLVPIKHSESFVSCDNEVWEEIHNFQTSLKQMYATENKSVLYCETVLPTTTGCWQTKLEVIPVPKSVEQDAPMYFKSALSEQSNDNNVHTKILSTSREKGIQYTIPKNFPYFHIQWDSGNAGYAYIIDNTNNNQYFQKDFGADIIANMMGLDPLRFNRKSKKTVIGCKQDEEKKIVLDFCSRFKKYDWTYELDKEYDVKLGH